MAVLAAGLEPAQTGLKVPGPSRRAPPAIGRPASCRTRPSAVSERRRHRLTPGRNDVVDTGRFGSPTSGVSCRRSASELCVRGGHGWFRSTASRVRRALSRLSYTTVGPAPGLEPGTTGLQSPRPSRWARPALLERHLITPRHPGAVLHRHPQRASAARKNPASPAPRMTPTTRRPPHGRCLRERRASAEGIAWQSPPFRWFGRKVSNPHLKDQNLASCHWTTPERIVLEGSMGTAPITRGWKPRVYLSTP
jgi:hypothetical protein